MTVLFESSFAKPDPRWKTRHTPTPDLPASDTAPRYTKKGRLRLQLEKTGNGGVSTSHLATLDQSFVFGKFEARMRFSGPKGAHSAFWLQDVTPNEIGGSEVDIVEHFGSDKTLWHNVYWRTPETMWPKEPTRWRTSTTTADPREWHVYGMEWYPDQYVFTIDGKVTGASTVGVSDKPKVMILSLLSSKWEWPRLDRDNLDRYKTMVDWVKVTE